VTAFIGIAGYAVVTYLALVAAVLAAAAAGHAVWRLVATWIGGRK
jgi:hypothetical protein